MGQHVLHTTGHKTYAYVSAAPEKKTPRTPFCLNERESPLSVRSRGKNACATSAFLLRCRPGKTHRRILLKMEKPFAWPLSPSHSSPLPSPFFLRLKWNESGNGSGWGWFSSSFFLSFLLFRDVVGRSSRSPFFFLFLTVILKKIGGKGRMQVSGIPSRTVVYLAWTREKLRNLDLPPKGYWKFWIVLPAGRIAFLGWLTLF